MTSHEDHSNASGTGKGAGSGNPPEPDPVGANAAGASNGADSGRTGTTEQGSSKERSGGLRNPVSRLADESRALFDDLREWVDLRVQLVQVDVEERIEKAANEIIAVVMIAVLGLFALAFLLHGLAIWLGEALGGEQWGYLIVAAILAVVTVILKSTKPGFVRRGGSRESGAQNGLPASSGQRPAELPPAESSRAGVIPTEEEETKAGGEHG